MTIVDEVLTEEWVAAHGNNWMTLLTMGGSEVCDFGGGQSAERPLQDERARQAALGHRALRLLDSSALSGEWSAAHDAEALDITRALRTGGE